MNSRVQKFIEPRMAVVFRWHITCIHETAASEVSMAAEVAELYLSTTPAPLRVVPFRPMVGSTDEMLDAKQHNRQVYRRMIHNETKRVPADIEDALVLALPDVYRQRCERDLAARRGLLAVRRMPSHVGGQMVSAGEMTKEFGELMIAAAPMMLDGDINKADQAVLKQVIAEADDVLAAVKSVRQGADDALHRPTLKAVANG